MSGFGNADGTGAFFRRFYEGIQSNVGYIIVQLVCFVVVVVFFLSKN